VLLGPVSRAQLIEEKDRLSPEAIAAATRARGCVAQAFGATDEIVEYLLAKGAAGEVVLIMSNGSFDGLTAKLLEKLAGRAGGRA